MIRNPWLGWAGVTAKNHNLNSVAQFCHSILKQKLLTATQSMRRRESLDDARVNVHSVSPLDNPTEYSV